MCKRKVFILPIIALDIGNLILYASYIMKTTIALDLLAETEKKVLEEGLLRTDDDQSVIFFLAALDDAEFIVFSGDIDEKDVKAVHEENAIAYKLYIGTHHANSKALFDYKFALPVKLGQFMDRLYSLVQGRSSGQLPRRLAIKEWSLHFPENILVSSGDGQEVELTDTEVQLIRSLYLAAEKGLRKQELLDTVWQYHKDVETHTLETHIYRLRQKLEIDPAKPEILVTTDSGYILKRA